MHHRVWWMAAVSLLSTISTAHATFNCGTTPVTLFFNLQLSENYVTSSSTTPCITTQSGYDIDLNGFSITCTNSSGCAEAIKGASGSGNVVIGSGTISGPFSRGVYGSIEEVRSVTIDGATSGIWVQNTKKVQKNVIINAVEEGIIATLQGNALDTIDNNFVSLTGTTGDGAIVAAGGATSGNGSKIEKNYLENYGTGIKFTDSTKFRVNNNIIGDREDLAYGASTPVSVGSFGTGKSFEGNLCTSATYCPTPTPPFTLP